jgi:hypothetical protein
VVVRRARRDLQKMLCLPEKLPSIAGTDFDFLDKIVVPAILGSKFNICLDVAPFLQS